MRVLSVAGALLLLPLIAPDALDIRHGGESAMSVNRDSYRLPGLPLYDPERFDRLAATLAEKVRDEPTDARIGPSGNVVPEKPGHRLDRERLADRFAAYYYGQGPAAFEAPTLPIYAKVDSELIASLRERTIGTYLTYYNSRNKNRSHNIALAARAIDSLVLLPGERFSFNRTVGMRTSAKGYLRAPVIVRGELSEDIGGGICQVSSTLFNAIDRAGLAVLERYSHSRHVPYVLPGRDATVSWGGPDLVFRNPYNQPVLIRAFASGGRMFISVHSSDLIEYRPREVPGVRMKLPEEITLKTDARHRER